MKRKILTIVGARPQFIKLAALSPEIRKQFDEIIVHTGQHYDYQMSRGFFEELNIPEPDYDLEVGSDSATKQIAKILLKLDEVLTIEKPDCVIVFGDTNSTAAGAIAAAKHNIKLAHIEAGLREFDKRIPEETNKLITDILCDLYFCPTQTGVDILKKMGITDKVYNVGDVMIDLNYRYKEQFKKNISLLNTLQLQPKNYYFATCHRAKNTDFKDNLRSILEALINADKPVLFPIHPRTKKAIHKCDFTHYLDHSNIIAIDPTGYFDTQTLIYHASAVLTDSGGVTKEAYFYKVPCILFDTQTEWIETVRENWNHITGPDTVKILSALSTLKSPQKHSNCLGDGHASLKVVNILNSELS